MTPQQLGLITFMIVTSINLGGLSLDAALFSSKLTTVTELARRNPWIASLIVLLNIIGTIGLAIHFTNGQGK